MASPRQIGKTRWNEYLSTTYRRLRSIRQTTDKILDLLRKNPLQVRLLALYMGDILSATGEAVEMLQLLEEIVAEDPRLEVQ